MTRKKSSTVLEVTEPAQKLVANYCANWLNIFDDGQPLVVSRALTKSSPVNKPPEVTAQVLEKLYTPANFLSENWKPNPCSS